MFCFWTLASVSEHCWRWRMRPKHLKCSVSLFSDPCVMFQNTNVVFLNTFNAILNIMDANACVPSVEFIYSVGGDELRDVYCIFHKAKTLGSKFFRHLSDAFWCLIDVDPRVFVIRDVAPTGPAASVPCVLGHQWQRCEALFDLSHLASPRDRYAHAATLPRCLRDQQQLIDVAHLSSLLDCRCSLEHWSLEGNMGNSPLSH